MTTSKNDSSLTTQTKIALLEQSIGFVNETLLRIEKRFDNIDKKFENIDRRFEKVEKEISSVRELGWSQFKWIMGTILISILIPIAKGFFTP